MTTRILRAAPRTVATGGLAVARPQPRSVRHLVCPGVVSREWRLDWFPLGALREHQGAPFLGGEIAGDTLACVGDELVDADGGVPYPPGSVLSTGGDACAVG
jgi:hypothetical protein